MKPSIVPSTLEFFLELCRELDRVESRRIVRPVIYAWQWRKRIRNGFRRSRLWTTNPDCAPCSAEIFINKYWLEKNLELSESQLAKLSEAQDVKSKCGL